MCFLFVQPSWSHPVVALTSITLIVMWLYFSSNQALCLRINTVLLGFFLQIHNNSITFDPSSTCRPSIRNKCLSFSLSFEVSLQALQSLIPVTRLLSLNNSDRWRRLITPGHSAAPFKDAARSQRLLYLFCKCEPLQDPNNDFPKIHPRWQFIKAWSRK